MSITRIFYATDIHGSEICFRKFIGAGEFYKANVLIYGGDLTGKIVVPIIKTSNGIYQAEVLGVLKEARNESELRALQEMLENQGMYYYITTAEDFEETRSDHKAVDQIFLKLMEERLRRWIRLAKEKLHGKNIKCYIMLGNDDHRSLKDVLAEEGEEGVVVDPEEKVVTIDTEHEMISLGYANITPWNCPGDLPEEELEKKIDELASKVNNLEKCIFNFHCPPYGTPIDQAPKLDENLRPIIGSSGPIFESVGSIAVRKKIEEYQPLLGLHGHIHEARGVCKIGRTLCINPGSEYGEGILRGVIVNIEGKKVKSYMFVSG